MRASEIYPAEVLSDMTDAEVTSEWRMLIEAADGARHMPSYIGSKVTLYRCIDIMDTERRIRHSH